MPDLPNVSKEDVIEFAKEFIYSCYVTSAKVGQDGAGFSLAKPKPHLVSIFEHRYANDHKFRIVRLV